MFKGGWKQKELSDEEKLAAIVEKVGLEKVGESYIGLCPLHTEATPSFSINARKMAFRCSGCHRAGKVENLYRMLFEDAE